MNFDAVILAGGKSSRMGRDKAFLEFSGQPLLARQISLACGIGASEIFISGRARVDYSIFNCPVLKDQFPNAGPLAGMASALDAVRQPLLLVLAVDMANMTGDFLKKLHAHCQNGAGAVPLCDGVIEPLAAFYPKSTGELAQKLLARSKHEHSPGAKHFAELCVQAGLARFVTVAPDEASLFKNWNSPADLPSAKSTCPSWRRTFQ